MTNVKEKLESLDIPVKPYKRGPIGKYNFAINRQGKFIRVWEGAADIEVRTNKRKRQALLTVEEPAREINTHLREVPLSHTENPRDLQEAKKTYFEYMMTHLVTTNVRDCLQIKVPNCTISYRDYEVNRDDYFCDDYLKLFVTCTARKTTTSFLLGFDENNSNYPFICQLKRPVDSIREAYEELKPKGIILKKGYKRQGEWFFNPVSKSRHKELMEKIHLAKKRPLNIIGKSFLSVKNVTSHYALGLRDNKKTYIIGKVYDSRKGRHKPIVLETWHEVHRNNEVEVSNRNVTWD